MSYVLNPHTAWGALVDVPHSVDRVLMTMRPGGCGLSVYLRIDRGQVVQSAVAPIELHNELMHDLVRVNAPHDQAFVRPSRNFHRPTHAAGCMQCAPPADRFS